MFNEFTIAQAEFDRRNARFNKMNEIEGVTVKVPNVVDRVWLALRDRIARRSNVTAPRCTTLAHDGVAAQ